MKCTDKEQETCEVEKRGCKGCYYYNNDEQENINNLFKYIGEDEIYQKYINNELKEISDFEMFCIHHCQDIEKLLKDYTRQKQINEEHQKINGELREKTKELEEENKIYVLNGDNVNLEIYIKNNYIPVQKVKDLIKNETINISGFECIALDDLKELLEDK